MNDMNDMNLHYFYINLIVDLIVDLNVKGAYSNKNQ